jgi:hypothetical protein
LGGEVVVAGFVGSGPVVGMITEPEGRFFIGKVWRDISGGFVRRSTAGIFLTSGVF